MLRSGRSLTRAEPHGAARPREVAALAAGGTAAAAVLAAAGAAPRTASDAFVLSLAACGAAAVEHAALALRGRGRRRRDLVEGRIDPRDPAVAGDVEGLAGVRARRTLARALRRAVDDAGRPVMPALVGVFGRALRDPHARSACLALADELERAGPADPRLVLRVRRLVCEGGSSLNGDCGRRLAEDAAGLTRGLALAASRPSGEGR